MASMETPTPPRLDETKKAAWRNLLTAHARLVERMDHDLAAAGVIGFDWYDVLLTLEEANGGRLKMGELADHVLISRSGLTRLVDRLEVAGYLVRENCPSDRRAVYAALTDAGRAARLAAWQVYEPAIIRYFGVYLSDTEATVVRDALGRALTALANP